MYFWDLNDDSIEDQSHFQFHRLRIVEEKVEDELPIITWMTPIKEQADPMLVTAGRTTPPRIFGSILKTDMPKVSAEAGPKENDVVPQNLASSGVSGGTSGTMASSTIAGVPAPVPPSQTAHVRTVLFLICSPLLIIGPG